MLLRGDDEAMSCIEPDAIDKWPPEITALFATQDLVVQSYSLDAVKIDYRRVLEIRKNTDVVIDRLERLNFAHS